MKKMFSDRLNSINLNFLFSGRTTVGGEWRGFVDSPTYTRLYFVVSGEGKIICDGRELKLLAGGWYLIPSGVSFEYSCTDSMDHIFFHLKLCSSSGPDLLSGLQVPMALSGGEELSQRIVSLNSPDLAELLSVKCDMLNTILKNLSKLGISLSEKRFSPAVEGGVRFINENLRSTLTAEEIAVALFVSKSTLAKHFRRELGMSVGEYINAAVLDEARRLLLGTRLSVKEISDSLAFSDQFYFSKKFKCRYGLSPREYRKKPIA